MVGPTYTKHWKEKLTTLWADLERMAVDQTQDVVSEDAEKRVFVQRVLSVLESPDKLKTILVSLMKGEQPYLEDIILEELEKLTKRS